MKDKRQGNDLKVAWSIFKKDGEPFRLEGLDVSLYLKNMFGRKELNDFVVTGNIIQWTFYGKDQKNSGKYSLEMVINEGEKGMITTDKCDFVNLVACSCKLQGGEDAPNVETESIELTSTLEFVAGTDYDDTALWKELENKVDKVEGLGLSEENYTADEKEKLAGLENYDDTELREELSKKLEAEFVASTEPTAEFPQLLYTPQTLTEAQKSQARKNIGVGEGSTEGGVELVEFIAEPLSEEDKAINAASYAKMVAGGDYIPCVKMFDFTLDVSCWGKEEEGFSLLIDSNLLAFLGVNSYFLTVFSDGHVMVDKAFSSPVLFTSELTTYESLRERAVALVGENSVNLGPIRIFGDSEGMGWVDGLIVQENSVILTYTTDYGEKYQISGYGGTINSVTKNIIAGGTIYLGVTDPTSTEAKKNKMASFFYGMPHTFNIKVVNDDTDWSYTPLMIKSGAVVIYRHNTMEGWRINSDGTTTLSQ